MLKDRCAALSQIKVARELKISAAYLNDVLQGRKDPGPKILEALGLDRRIEYFKRSTKGKAK